MSKILQLCLLPVLSGLGSIPLVPGQPVTKVPVSQATLGAQIGHRWWAKKHLGARAPEVLGIYLNI